MGYDIVYRRRSAAAVMRLTWAAHMHGGVLHTHASAPYVHAHVPAEEEYEVHHHYYYDSPANYHDHSPAYSPPSGCGGPFCDTNGAGPAKKAASPADCDGAGGPNQYHEFPYASHGVVSGCFACSTSAFPACCTNACGFPDTYAPNGVDTPESWHNWMLYSTLCAALKPSVAQEQCGTIAAGDTTCTPVGSSEICDSGHCRTKLPSGTDGCCPLPTSTGCTFPLCRASDESAYLPDGAGECAAGQQLMASPWKTLSNYTRGCDRCPSEHFSACASMACFGNTSHKAPPGFGGYCPDLVPK